MPGPSFWQTGLGRVFFEAHVPALVKALERIATAMEKQPAAEAAADAGRLPDRRDFDDELRRAAGYNAGVYREAMAMAVKWAKEQTGQGSDRAGERAIIGEPEQVWQMLRHKLPADQEGFWVVAIDVRNGLLGEPLQVALGAVNSVEVHPREIFREAIRRAAVGIIVAHNHPTGDPTPSSQDIELTQRLRAVGDLVGIPVIDHLVLTPERYRSIAEWTGTEW